MTKFRKITNLSPLRRRLYIPMRRGFLYLVAIMDWFRRKVLAWRLSSSRDADFCVDALKEALAKHGPPEIFNTDSHTIGTSSRVV